MVKYHKVYTALQLKHSESSAAAMRQKCQADWPRLHSLCLYKVKLGTAAIQAKPPASWPELRSLKLYYTQLNEAALAHLGRLPPQLCDLHLEEDNISVAMLSHLRRALRQSLTQLTLRSKSAEWGEEAGLHIARGDWVSKIEA